MNRNLSMVEGLVCHSELGGYVAGLLLLPPGRVAQVKLLGERPDEE